MVAAHGYDRIDSHDNVLEGQIAINTLISSCASCLALSAVLHYREKEWLISKVCNSILSGAVAITAGCATMRPPYALLTGFVAGIAYYWFSHFLVIYRIDDPLEASVVHGVSGMWGLFAAVLFSEEDLIHRAYEPFAQHSSLVRPFGTRLLIQLFGILMIVVYTITVATAAFMLIHRILGLRIQKTLEERGLNQQFHDDGYIAFSKGKVGYQIDFHVPSNDYYPVNSGNPIPEKNERPATRVWNLKNHSSISRSRSPGKFEQQRQLERNRMMEMSRMTTITE